MSSLLSGVSICGVSERTERPGSGLPDCQQPDPNGAQDHRHGGDGGGVSVRRTTAETLTWGG